MKRAGIAAALAVVAGACSTSPTAKHAASTTAPQAQRTTTTAAACASLPTTTAAGGSGKEVNPPGDIPDNQAFVVFQPPSGEYSVKVPEGWAQTSDAHGVLFSDKFNAIRVEVTASPAAPTVDFARSVDFAQVVAADPCASLVSIASVSRSAGPAVLIRYQTNAARDAVTGKVVRQDVERYEFWKNGRQANVTLSGAVGSDNVDPWKIVTESFTWH